MWNELFITYNGPSLFLEILSNYTRSVDRQIIRILKLKEDTCDSMGLKEVPFIKTITGEKISCPLEIGRFISTITGASDILFGRSSEEIKSHENFIKDFAAAKCKFSFLETPLRFNSFCNGYNITISDLYAYGNILVDLQKFDDSQKHKFSNVIRWALHIQSLKGISEQIGRLKLNISAPFEKLFIEINPKTDSKDDGKKTKEKKVVKEVDADKQKEIEAKIAQARLEKEAKKKDKKDEPQKKPEKKEKKEEDTRHPISKLDIKVGKIISIHENTQGDKLYNEEIDIGNGEIRKIASGLRGLIPIEKLNGAMVVVLCNLKAKELKGWLSHGMVLCAKKDGVVDIMHPPQGSQPGDVITIGDYERLPDVELNTKKSWDLVKDKIFTDSNGLAVYDEKHIWKTSKGDITNPTLKNAVIS